MERYDDLTEEQQAVVYDDLTEKHWDLIDQLQIVDNERALVMNALKNNTRRK